MHHSFYAGGHARRKIILINKIKFNVQINNKQAGFPRGLFIRGRGEASIPKFGPPHTEKNVGPHALYSPVVYSPQKIQ